jgi:nickel-dependent lactate racemase
VDNLVTEENTLACIELPYTDRRQLSFEIPERCVAKVYRPKATPVVAASETLIKEALDHPLGSRRLEERVQPGDKILIICDDLTRPTPAARLIPPILDRLNRAGVPDKDIEVLFALGTHRPMTDDEMRAKVGDQVFQRVACHNHNALDKATLYYFGKSQEGIEVWLNRRIKDASLVIGIGNLVPHPIAGYAGGAKILYPGVAGEETIAGFHVSFGLDPTNYYGASSAPARTSIHHLADVAGLDFLVNTVLSDDGQIQAVLAGHHKVILELGIKVAKEIYGVPVDHLYDVVVVSSYPAWIEFWQGGKGVYAGATLAKPGGEIILASACPEGAARTHPDFAPCVGMKPETVASRLARGEFDDAIGAAIAVKVARLRERYRISLVSGGLSQDEIELMGFDRYDTVEDALAAAFSRQGQQDEIGVVPYGGHTYCYLANE